MPQLAQVGDYCPNAKCCDYGKPQDRTCKNIIKFGRTQAGRQRYQCTTCRRTFTETKGTLFYRKRTAEHEILESLAFLAEGSRTSSVARVKHHKEDTLAQWLREAAAHATRLEEPLLKEFKVKRGQLDALWSYVGHKGEKNYRETANQGQFWRATMVDMESRLRVARGIAKTETQASVQVFRTLQRRGHPDAPPATVSNGWGGIDDAMLEVYGQVPVYKGIGRPPTHKQPQPGWQYLQVVKHRNAQGRITEVELRVVYGDPAAVLAFLGKSTAYVERTHLTMRHFNSRLGRKTIAFSKELQMHQAAATWDDFCYNLIHAHKSLRQVVVGDPPHRWRPRTPAMAARLTNHVWTVKELLTTLPVPSTNNT